MIVLCASVLLILKRLNPIFSATEVIITYGIKPFDICEKNGDLWKYIKIFYITTFLTSNIICSNLIFNKIPTKKKGNKKCPKRKVEDIEKLNLLIGVNKKTKRIKSFQFLCEKIRIINIIILCIYI